MFTTYQAVQIFLTSTLCFRPSQPPRAKICWSVSWDDGSKLDCYNPIKLSVNPINLANLGMVFTSHGDFGDGSLVYHMILFVIRSCPKMFWGACAASKEWRLGRVPGEWWRNAQCTKTWDYTLLELNMLEIPFVCCQISKIMFQQYLIWLLSPLLVRCAPIHGPIHWGIWGRIPGLGLGFSRQAMALLSECEPDLVTYNVLCSVESPHAPPAVRIILFFVRKGDAFPNLVSWEA